MQIEMIQVEDIIPYENNPRRNDEAVEKVAASIREFGFKVPIIIDKDNVIVAGHTCLKAAELLGFTEVPVIRADDLTEEQVRAFRLADNKTAELAEWDFDKLMQELDGIASLDMGAFGFETYEEQVSDDVEKYTNAVEVPHYDVQGKSVLLTDLVNTEKAKMLVEEINASRVSDDEKLFLRMAAGRLHVFNYKNIAEYYASADPEMQNLMEKLALVIIDYDNAIANGYVKLSKKLSELRIKENA